MLTALYSERFFLILENCVFVYLLLTDVLSRLPQLLYFGYELIDVFFGIE